MNSYTPLYTLLLVALIPCASIQAQSDTHTPQEAFHVQQVMRLYEEVWQQKQYHVADELFAPSYTRHDGSEPPTHGTDSPSQGDIARSVMEIMPDFTFTIETVVAKEDLVAVRWRATGTPAGFPNVLRTLVGKSGPSESTGINIYRFENGRVVELWNNRDDLTIAQDTGQMRWANLGSGILGMLLFAAGAALFRRRSQHAESAKPIV